MSTRITFTSITPLPPNVTRATVIDFLHDHAAMIDLNPLVTERHPIAPPDHAQVEERKCEWYSITDRIEYLPRGLVTGDVTYTCAFHDLPQGLQTHCYAGWGLDIRDKWCVGGILRGETPEPQELGLGAPATGLYLREDVDFRCNVLMAAFVKKTLKKAHTAVVGALAAKAQGTEAAELDPGTRRPVEQRPAFVSSGSKHGQPCQGQTYEAYQIPGLHEAEGTEPRVHGQCQGRW